MSGAATLDISLRVGIYDTADLHAAAVQAYTHGDDSLLDEAYEALGGPTDPDLTACLVELWAEHCPASAGYEFHRWEGRDA